MTDEILFDTLFEKYFSPLVVYCMHRFGQNRFDAEDNVSEVFICLFRAWDRMSTHTEAGLTKWLYDKAKYVYFDKCRADKRKPTVISYEDYMENHDEEERPECQDNYSDCIREIKKALRPDEWDVFVKIVIDGKGIKETAQSLGAKPNSVKVKWFRIRMKLKPILL